MRPPDLPGGNCPQAAQRLLARPASMRPPDLPGGNMLSATGLSLSLKRASMRPPDLPGGNRTVLLVVE